MADVPDGGSKETVPGQPVLDYAGPRHVERGSGPIPPGLRWAGVVAGAVLPVICFTWAVHGYPLGPEWQSGRIEDYAKLFMHGRVSWPFFPLLAVCITCMVMACRDPARNGARWWVRWGVYAGVPLATQYCVIAALTGSNGTMASLTWPVGMGVAAVAIGAVVTWLANLAYHRFPPERVNFFLGAMLILTVMALPVGIMIVATAPALTFATYLAVSIALRRFATVDEAARRGPGLGGEVATGAIGLGAYAGAWAMAVREAIRMYQTLPPTPPAQCYVASAAAGGHAAFVGSRSIGIDGVSVAVNDQLRRLKALEIALAVGWPAGHRAVRRVYDRIGPLMARVIRRNRWLSDAAYVSLKPFEWVGVWAVRRAVADFDRLAAGIYAYAPDGAVDSKKLRGR